MKQQFVRRVSALALAGYLREKDPAARGGQQPAGLCRGIHRERRSDLCKSDGLR